MKFNTLFVAAICAGSLMTSCVHETAKKNQLKYTHTSIVDGDGFAFFKVVGETALSGVQYAENAENSGDANAAAVAVKVKAYYNQLIPALDSLATANHMDFPIKGIPAVEVESTTAPTDSTAQATESHIGASDYVHHAQHELATVKDQLERLTRNTDAELQKFAKEQLEVASELYKEIGGKEEAHAHH